MTSTCDVDVEVVRRLAVLVRDDALVRALVLLFEALDAEDDLIGGAICPTFEANSRTTAAKLNRTLE